MLKHKITRLKHDVKGTQNTKNMTLLLEQSGKNTQETRALTFLTLIIELDFVLNRVRECIKASNLETVTKKKLEMKKKNKRHE